jgi:hypothetical protein
MILPPGSPGDEFQQYIHIVDKRRENLSFYLKDEENDEYVKATAPPEYTQYWLDHKTAGSSPEIHIPEPV